MMLSVEDEALLESIEALRPRVLPIVSKGVWHCTNPERYRGIVAAEAILPEPSIADRERWKTGAGAKNYPFARHIGAVSLFQFEPFDADTYDHDYPVSDWRTFVPCVRKWPATVWIEIDTTALGGFISGPALIQRWRDEAAYGHTIMPVIEAAHVGALPIAAFKRSLIVRPSDRSVSEFDPDER